MSHDILIVGGGIGGAVLANLLSRSGKRVVVLEKNLVRRKSPGRRFSGLTRSSKRSRLQDSRTT